MSILQDMYDSEINFKIRVEWDGGFQLDFGNGYDDSIWEYGTTVKTWDEAEDWFIEQVLAHYPDSVLAKEIATRRADALRALGWDKLEQSLDKLTIRKTEV